jgi:hypothetical protein
MPFPQAGQGGVERRLIRIGFGGGATVPTRHAADAFERGVNGQAFLLIDPGFGVPIRLNLGYQKFDLKETALAAGAGGVTGGQSQMTSGVAGITINLLRLGPVRPYVTAGLGAFALKDEVTSGSETVSSSAMRFGVDGGGGLAIRLGRLEAFVEGRVQNVYTDAGVIGTKTIQSVPITFGVIF